MKGLFKYIAYAGYYGFLLTLCSVFCIGSFAWVGIMLVIPAALSKGSFQKGCELMVKILGWAKIFFGCVFACVFAYAICCGNSKERAEGVAGCCRIAC